MIKVAAFPNGSGSTYWRLVDPFKYLNQTGKFDCRIIDTGINDEVAQWADIYVLQGCVDRQGINLLHAYQQGAGKKIVVDHDDALEIESNNPHLREHQLTNAPEVIAITMGIADMVTTTTPYLANRLKQFNSNVVVLPNYMDLDRWKLATHHNTSSRQRLGWMGSITHLEDLKLIEKPLKHAMKKFNCECVFMGDPRIADLFKGYPVEVILGQPFDFYPYKLHGLRIDIGLAPLRDTEFNRCKSPIKIMEYAICHTPCIASDTTPYNCFDVPHFIANTETQWMGVLNNLLSDPSNYQNVGLEAYNKVVEDYSLSDHIGEWIKAYQMVYNK